MNLHEWREKDPMDRYLRRCLKHWAGRPQPPVDGRARLLWSAAMQPSRTRIRLLDLLINWFYTDTFERQYTPQSNSLVSVALFYSYQSNIGSVL